MEEWVPIQSTETGGETGSSRPGFRPPSGIPVKDFEQKDGVFTGSSLDGGLAESGGERDPEVTKTLVTSRL